MLGKLIKYEFKSLLRIFIPLYLVMIALSFIMVVDTNLSEITGFVMFAFVMVGLSISVGLAIFTVLRFNTALFGNEGYLMFTLPVSVEKIIISKAITMLIYFVLAGITGFMSLLIIFIRAEIIELHRIPMYIEEILEVFNSETAFLLINLLLYSIISVLSFVLSVYASISVGQIVKNKKLKNVISFVFYFVVTYIFARLMIFTDSPISILGGVDYIEGYTMSVNISFLIYNIANLIKALIMFAITSIILKNKLNLE